MSNFKVEQIDHVEVFVDERWKGAKWYSQNLGLEILKEHEHWASPDGGPLMISSDKGKTMIALFEGPLQKQNEINGICRVAFRVNGHDFVLFVNSVHERELYDREGKKIDRLEIHDHEKAYSVYFCDPYGNLLEVTTYEYDVVSLQI